jgi:hypothetical protein
MRILKLALHAHFAQQEHRESPSAEVKTHQVLDHYEGVLEVEADQRTFTAKRYLYRQKISDEDIKKLLRDLKKDVAKQVELYVFRDGMGALKITHSDLVGFPTKYEVGVLIENSRCEASFMVTRSFQEASLEDFLPRVKYQLKRQILSQIYAKLFEGWEV